jgi:hypothetical protein
MPTNLRTWSDRLLVAGFILGITLPAAVGLSRSDCDLAGEARRLAEWPVLRLKRAALREYPEKAEAAFNDRLAGRAALVRANAVVRADWLGVSTSPQVNLGRDGWLFLDLEGWRRTNLASIPQPAPCEQAAAWAKVLRQRRDWLAAQGIGYLVVSVPEKDGVYGDLLPPLARRRGTSPTNLLLADLAADGKTAVLDLTGVLRREREAGTQVYLRTDTHWNSAGAFAASRAVIDELRRRWLPGLNPGTGAVAARLPGPAVTRDLTRLLGLDGERPEADIWLRPAEVPSGSPLGEQLALAEERHAPRHIPAEVWGHGRADGPRAVMFHDSFGETMRPYLSGHFSRIGFAPSQWLDPAVIRQVRPAVVIQEIVERTTDHVGAANVPEVCGGK